MRRIQHGDHPSQFVELYDPRATPTNDTVVLIHGGYWRNPYGVDLMYPLADWFRDRGATVVNLEYRRIGDLDESPRDVDGHPPAVWPEMSADILAGIDFAIDLIPSAGGKLTVVGHSAGGHLALWAAARRSKIDVVVALAPLADLVEADRQGLSTDAAATLLGGHADEIPHRYSEASPLARVPVGARHIVVHGTDDESVPIELTDVYVEAARGAGDEVAYLRSTDLDHMAVIDPHHSIWLDIAELL